MKDKNLLINKTANLLKYYGNIIFLRIKEGLKAFQSDLEKDQEGKIKKCFESQTLIKEKEFKNAIRSFIALFLSFEKDKENNIKENDNNIVNYLDIPDLWDITISEKGNFHKELNNLKQLNVKVNQIVSLYEFLGEDINEEYFEDVEKALKNDEELKKIEEKKEPPENYDEIDGDKDEIDHDSSGSESDSIKSDEDNDDKNYI